MQKQFVIYATLIGGYDEIRQPLVLDDRFDYILFSDCINDVSIGVWQVHPLELDITIPKIKCSYTKCCPTLVLPEYKASLCIDANLQIATQWVYDRFIELYESGVEWAGIKHIYQNNVYEEMQMIMHLKWVHDYDVINWYSKLRKEGYIGDNGLLENNVIFRRHTDRVEAIGNEWWNTMQKECKRDQFSLMYLLWKYDLTPSLFLPAGECALTNSKNIVCYPHNPHKRILKLGLNERIRRSCWLESPNGNLLYGTLFDQLWKYKYPKIVLYLWEVKAVFLYGPRVIKRLLKHEKSN